MTFFIGSIICHVIPFQSVFYSLSGMGWTLHAFSFRHPQIPFINFNKEASVLRQSFLCKGLFYSIALHELPAVMSSLAPYIFVRGEIVPAEKAVLHVSDLAIQRGYGIFDFFKIQDGHPYFLPDYLDRFYASAAVMRLEVPYDRAALTAIIYELMAKNNVPSSGIKMILTGGYSPDGYQPFEPNLILTQQALTLPTIAQVAQGIKIITHDFIRDIPAVKTINYSMGIWLIEKINQHQAADVLYHHNGKVSEFPRCNFFIVKHDNTVLTPTGNVLQGITRKNILSFNNNPWPIREADLSLEDVYTAKEAFLTSTTKRIVPIVQVNDHTIGSGKPGEVSLALLEQLKKLEVEDFKNGVAKVAR